MFCRKLVVAFDAVGRDADDNRVGRFEFAAQRAEIDRFGGAAGRVVLGVEIRTTALPWSLDNVTVPSPLRGKVKSGAGPPIVKSVIIYLSFAGMLSESCHIRYIAKPRVVQITIGISDRFDLKSQS